MKNKGVSRIRNRIMLILLMTFFVLFLLGYMIKSTFLMCLAIPFFVIACILLITTNRCPNCGKSFRGVYWSKNAGFCRKCGKKIYFDDEISEE